MASWSARLRSERSGFETCMGTLCCVPEQATLLSQRLSPPRYSFIEMDTGELLGRPNKIAGECPAMD